MVNFTCTLASSGTAEGFDVILLPPIDEFSLIFGENRVYFPMVLYYVDLWGFVKYEYLWFNRVLLYRGMLI